MDNDENTKRERSPAFPYFGLEKSITYAQILYQKARRSDVRLQDIADAWGFSETSSSLLRTAAALLAFGLIRDTTSGGQRKVAVTDLALRILEDARPGAKEAALRDAASRVQIIRQVREQWGSQRPDEQIALSALKFDFDFGDIAARRFLNVYDETIPFLEQASSPEAEASEPKSINRPNASHPLGTYNGLVAQEGAPADDARIMVEARQSGERTWFTATLPAGPRVSVNSEASLTAKNLKSLIRLLSVLHEEMIEEANDALKTDPKGALVHAEGAQTE